MFASHYGKSKRQSRNDYALENGSNRERRKGRKGQVAVEGVALCKRSVLIRNRSAIARARVDAISSDEEGKRLK